MLFNSWLRSAFPASRTASARRRPATRLIVETLEDRCVLSASLVADINPGAASSNPQNLTNANGALYFNANGTGVWKSDGTPGGTVLLKDSSTFSGESVFTPVNGTVLFNDSEGVQGALWRTDGTPAGTVLLKAVGVFASPHPGGRMPVINGRVFFSGYDTNAGQELWASDGTAAGTVLVKDIYSGSAHVTDDGHGHGGGGGGVQTPYSSGPGWLTDVNGTLFFSASDGKSGVELWKSDGTAKGTVLVKDIAAGGADSNPLNLTAVGGALYFGAAGGLWKSNGTSAGTVQLGTFASPLSDLIDVNGSLFFANGGELWKSDGTPSGTVRVVASSVAADPQALTAVGGRLYFNAVGSGSGRELWRSDGTASGTFLVKDINPGAGDSTPGGLTRGARVYSGLTNVNGLLYFAADDGAHGRELWQSDGTAAGTVLVRDINSGAASSSPDYLVAMNNKLYFAATDSVHGRELWDPPAVGGSYQQTNLTGFQEGMARHVDPNLNGWGMDYAPDGAFCVANTATGTATFYDAKGKPLPTVITIPAAPGQPFGPVGSPTGIAYNSTTDFVISKNGKSAPARFLFDTLDGLICGWNPDVDPINAVIMVDNSGEHPFPASYTGLAIGHDKHGHNVLYAADSGSSPTASNNRIDLFDGRFRSTGSFTDRNVEAQYPGNTVFQVEDVDDKLFVTYAGFTAPFGGVVDVFDGDGKLLTPNHFAANAPGQGPLENPWGIVKAPANFGPFSNDILIGNVEGDGNINAFDPASGKFLGSLRHPDGTPIAITGLWDLTFGGGDKLNGKPDDLFFDAGPNAADFAGNGLFGVIVADQKPTATTTVADRERLTLDAGEVQMHFAATDPVTLAYTGSRLRAAATQHPSNKPLIPQQMQPPLSEALAGRQAAGSEAFNPSPIDQPGLALGDANDPTIWLNVRAASRDWLIDATRWDGGELTTPDDQGEQHPSDLPTIRAHALGLDHQSGRQGKDYQATGGAWKPQSGSWVVQEEAILDLVFAGEQVRLPREIF